jgi:hypothetical protein
MSPSTTAVVAPTTTNPPPTTGGSSTSCSTNSDHNTTSVSNTMSNSSTSGNHSHIQYRRSTRTALYVGSNYISSNHNSNHPPDPTVTTKPSDSSVVIFPRRWPGIGASFQCTKIPPLLLQHSNSSSNNASNSSTNYVQTRPPPLRMSHDYPHCTMADVEKEASIATQTTEERNGTFR